MSNVVALPSAGVIEQVLIGGDLSKLSSADKVTYMMKVCETLSLNHLTQPFAYIKLNGKEVLYAKRDATDQLRRVHKVSVKIVSREQLGDVWVVTAQAFTPDGRYDESVGAVPHQGLKGDALANALMKCETKAKRRVTLSICGLGLLDETEIESIPAEAKEVAQVNPLKDARDASALAVSSPGDYVCTFGKYNGKKLSSIEPFDLSGYIDYIIKKAEKDQKSITGKVKEFLEAADKFLEAESSFANSPSPEFGDQR
jgi:hypothetical protein